MTEATSKKKKIKLNPAPSAVKECIFNTMEPLIIKNILSWDILQWSLDDWTKCLGDSKLEFRMGTKQCTKVPQWESNCETVFGSLSEALVKSEEDNSGVWMYFDYKHLSQYFKTRSDLLESLSWADFGLPDKNGKDSTIWIGTEGAYTPCHMDSYGCNLVAQVHGRKLWVLFPPSSTSKLNPTRVPYEESSIYSNIHFSCGKNINDDLEEARVVELSPGDVLVVPKHWWHYVENLSTAISINMWIPRESDDSSRLEEALVRFSVATIIKGLDVDVSSGKSSLLNPNEMDLPDETINLQQISWCLDQVVAKGMSEEEMGNKSLSLPDTDLSCMVPVSKVSSAQLRRLLLEKCGCVNSSNDHCDTTKLNKTPLAAEDVISAFCHPSVVSQVAKLLLMARK